MQQDMEQTSDLPEIYTAHFLARQTQGISRTASLKSNGSIMKVCSAETLFSMVMNIYRILTLPACRLLVVERVILLAVLTLIALAKIFWLIG
jgi:hypothetical protein